MKTTPLIVLGYFDYVETLSLLSYPPQDLNMNAVGYSY